MRSVWLWIAVAVCSLCSVAAIVGSGSSDGIGKPRDTEIPDNELMPLTLINGADSKGAVCLDGTLPGYHLDRGFGSGANSWLIHLEVHQISMSSSAGDAFSRRRWSLSSPLSSAFIPLFAAHFKFQMLRSRSLLQTEERDTQRSLCRSHELRLLVSTIVLLTVLLTCSVCSPAMSREDSLTTVVLRFTGTFPGELHSGCLRKSYTVDLSRVLQLIMELSSQRSSSCFPSPGSETAKLPHVAPFYLYGARVQGNSSSDPSGSIS
ncbi:hypothetical protein F2Q69_00062441 [Brassica cretica]|uniref:Pectin acetylesterase n=1 Tax=Brassica cretica TaxID=69181 RepID=A0A8S9RBL2_BRACR|nr:hypothetical protein F2Q69_00062441 [Brassica cretica]